VNQLTLTALDGLSNEVHDVHHPVDTGLYYEDQKEEAKRKADGYLKNRLPKFLGYFERVLGGEASKGGEWLYGGRLTYADLVLFRESFFSLVFLIGYFECWFVWTFEFLNTDLE